MALSDIEFCRPVPDDDPLFANIPAGSALDVDGVMYVRMSDWLPFLEAVHAVSSSRNEFGIHVRPHA